MKKVLITGDRPTGKLHLGHYFGSLQKRVELQSEYETYILVADVQALTDNFENPEKVRKNVREIVLDYLAAGIDPKYSNIYIQSKIPEVAELTVYFSNLVTVNRLFRNPPTKAEASQKDIFNKGKNITYGFLGYPVRQAADISALEGDIVPVGEDQVPHIEQTREIVRKFNSIYGETLKEPEQLLSTNPRVKGLDGNAKMSKSLNNCIYLKDDEKAVSSKVMDAVTDTNKIRKNDPADPSKCTVYYYHELIKSSNLKNICEECKKGERGCVACKKELIKEMMDFLKPMQERRKYYEDNPQLVDKILIEGTANARKKAQSTMKRVKRSMK